MKYLELLQIYSRKEIKFGYREFHELYSHIQFSLGIEFAQREECGGDSVEVLNLRKKIFDVSYTELRSYHLKDDEYGTEAYCGKNMSYLDCAYSILSYLKEYEHLEVNAVLCDGEVNSVYLDDVLCCPVGLENEIRECEICECEDDELPF